MVGFYRVEQTFQQSILIEGLLNLRKAMGPTWNNYNRGPRCGVWNQAKTICWSLFADDGQNALERRHCRILQRICIISGRSTSRPCVPPIPPTPMGNLRVQSIGRSAILLRFPTALRVSISSFAALHQMTGALTPGSNLARQFNIAFQKGSTAKSAWLGDWGMYSPSAI